MKPHEYRVPRRINREPDKCTKNLTSEEKQPKAFSNVHKAIRYFRSRSADQGETGWISDRIAMGRGFISLTRDMPLQLERK
jgi:hypothetical protein